MNKWFEKLGVWVWMAGEGKTRGASSAFAGRPTTMTLVMLLTIMLVMCSSLLTSCKSHKHIEETSHTSEHYTISSLSIDSTLIGRSEKMTLNESFWIEVFDSVDYVKPAKVIKIRHEAERTDTTNLAEGHLIASQSKIDSIADTSTTYEKNVQHTQNLITTKDYIFASIILLLILAIIYIRKSL